MGGGSARAGEAKVETPPAPQPAIEAPTSQPAGVVQPPPPTTGELRPPTTRDAWPTPSEGTRQTPTTRDTAPSPPTVATSSPPTLAPPPPPTAVGGKDDNDAEGLSAPRAGAAAGAAEGARWRALRVKEQTRARVERMRDEALVVLEETPDDSGLRFVLVAAALFFLFLLFLFLSTSVLR
jgi:hypothetical protein